MPTQHELRLKNEQFANKARAGKNPVNPSRQEKIAKRSPISSVTLGVVVFVVCGGVLFELIRVMFL